MNTKLIAGYHWLFSSGPSVTKTSDVMLGMNVPASNPKKFRLFHTPVNTFTLYTSDIISANGPSLANSAIDGLKL